MPEHNGVKPTSPWNSGAQPHHPHPDLPDSERNDPRRPYPPLGDTPRHDHPVSREDNSGVAGEIDKSPTGFPVTRGRPAAR